MAKKAVKKVSDKMSKVNDNFTVNMYDNGYMIEVGGRDTEDNWATAKFMVGSVEELINTIKEISEMERDN